MSQFQDFDLFGNPLPPPKVSTQVEFSPEQFTQDAIEVEPEPTFDPVVEKMIEEEEASHAKQQQEALVEAEQKLAEEPQSEEGQAVLFDKGEWWHEHWKGMPEFKSEDLTPFKQIIVNFENRSDIEKFAKLVGQTINLTTKSIWYPAAEIDEVAKLRWLSHPNKLKEDKLNQKKQELIEILDGE